MAKNCTFTTQAMNAVKSNRSSNSPLITIKRRGMRVSLPLQRPNRQKPIWNRAKSPLSHRHNSADASLFDNSTGHDRFKSKRNASKSKH